VLAQAGNPVPIQRLSSAKHDAMASQPTAAGMTASPGRIGVRVHARTLELPAGVL
jgi:hypothetical protein